MKDFAKKLAAIELIDDREKAVGLGSAWRDQPALLVFIRHFG